MVTIQIGIGNQLRKDVKHTSEIKREWVEALGGNFENAEYFVNGVSYVGALADEALVDVRQKTNGKGA